MAALRPAYNCCGWDCRSSQTFLSLSFDALFGVNSFKGIHHFLLYIDKRTNKESKCQCTLSNRKYLVRYNDTWNTFTAQAQLGSRLRAHTESHFKFLHLAWTVHRSQDRHTITIFKILVTTKAVSFFWVYLSLCFCCQQMTNEPKQHRVGIYKICPKSGVYGMTTLDVSLMHKKWNLNPTLNTSQDF